LGEAIKIEEVPTTTPIMMAREKSQPAPPKKRDRGSG
jgi:hypothetical protein